MHAGAIKAVLGPTNTGKTHLAVERLCGHSSGMIGFPLRLLAREVYDRVVAIKGAQLVALITGEERIEPPGARYRLCTAEAMDRDADVAFLAIDEAQLGADRERGHVFTDRLLNARGREETMILGSDSLAPLVRTLVPEAEIVSRPRFSTLTHAGPAKLSRLPPRSAIVAFSSEQVYAVAETLRRFRGGAAVVMGALSPQTRNAQVAMFEAGEVDYIVATDAIGMGLNLDVAHVAFASLTKFDGVRRRRLTVAEMAQIAGRAGRHQKDGTFGTLVGKTAPEFSEEEVAAIEDHRFPMLERLYWRDARPRYDTLATLIADLEAPPDDPALAAAPEAVDLSVARILAADPAIAARASDPATVARFWDACSLPDFRQLGPDHHARFVARLWDELSQGDGRIAADYAARKLGELERSDGDIETLQGRIAAIRSWTYIAQRPDWLAERETLAERARDAERALSDALHDRLTERFVNRRTSVLLRKLGGDKALLPVRLDEADRVLVDGEEIGRLEGFAFRVDSQARMETRRMLLAAGERHLPGLLAARAQQLCADCERADGPVAWDDDLLTWHGRTVAHLMPGATMLTPRAKLDKAAAALPPDLRKRVLGALSAWLDRAIAAQLAPLLELDAAARADTTGATLRAVLVAMVAQGGVLERGDPRIGALDDNERRALRTLGARRGALDVFLPAMMRAPALTRWAMLARLAGEDPPPVAPEMTATRAAAGRPPVGYRRAGKQFVRVDIAERLLHAAHKRRDRWAPRKRGRQKGPAVALDPTLALSMGLTTATFANLLRQAGFRATPPPTLKAGMFGPPSPPRWRWHPPRPRTARVERRTPAPRPGNPFAELAEMLG